VICTVHISLTRVDYMHVAMLVPNFLHLSTASLDLNVSILRLLTEFVPEQIGETPVKFDPRSLRIYVED
jgi:predicted trehalose synthase